jgi:hypothetical protein
MHTLASVPSLAGTFGLLLLLGLDEFSSELGCETLDLLQELEGPVLGGTLILLWYSHCTRMSWPLVFVCGIGRLKEGFGVMVKSVPSFTMSAWSNYNP